MSAGGLAAPFLYAALAGKAASLPNALRRSQTSDTPLTPGAPIRIPLLVIIFTQKENEQRRAWQRKTWLGQQWVRGELERPMDRSERPSVGWRYVYMMARSAAGSSQPAELDRVIGDSVTLSAVQESYANLVYKTLEAVRWSLNHVAFGALLKTDDDSIVHVGRVSAWLHHVKQRGWGGTNMAMSKPGKGSIAALYAGRVFNDSQIIRANYTRRELMHPEWYPDDFVKWAIPYESYNCRVPHSLQTPCYYPPYCSGGGYILGSGAARRILRAYDARVRARRPVVRVEDAYVGILATEGGVRPIDASELFQDPPAGRPQDAAVFGGQLLVHRVQEPQRAFKWLTFPVKTAFDAGARTQGAYKGKKRRKSKK